MPDTLAANDRAELLAVIAQQMDGAHRALAHALRMQAQAEERLWALERSAEGGIPLAQARDERAKMQWTGSPPPRGAEKTAPPTPKNPADRLAALRQHRDKMVAIANDERVPAATRDNARAALAQLEPAIERASARPAKPVPADPPADPTNDRPAEGAPFTPSEKAVATADHAARLKMPSEWFLQGDARKYPVRDDKGALSKALLTHAEERASANGHQKIAAEAHALLKQHFETRAPVKPEPKAEQPPVRKRRFI